MFNDTILAISSPPVPGGLRGIVRLSGPHAWEVARAICDARHERGWAETPIAYAPGVAVRGALLLFEAPKTYTGEDIAEIHLPNSLPLMHAVIGMLRAAAQRLGRDARMAEAGEFSSRAFFNGKMDLTQCEGIAATVSATHKTQLRAAAALRAGSLHRDTAALAERLANLLALVEAGIDFADEEDIHFIDAASLGADLAALAAGLHARLESSIHIEQLAAPPTVVFIGKPNVGKSSLVNALAGAERSIVSPEAGTTRDILAATLATPQGEIRLLDVPGEEAPTDELRQKMMAAREQALLDADLVVEVLDASSGNANLPIGRMAAADHAARSITIFNKSDLCKSSAAPVIPATLVSAKTGDNIDALRTEITRVVTARDHAGGERLALNHRHRALMLDALRAIRRAGDLAATPAARTSPELLAAEMRAALDLLGQITGTVSPDEVLGRIFSQFCIGK